MADVATTLLYASLGFAERRLQSLVGATLVDPASLARTLRDAHVKVILWAGAGDMSLSYGHDAALTQAGLDKVIAAGKEFGLPVGINGTTDFQKRYDQGVRAFFDIGPAYAAAGPSITPAQRKAAGR